MLSLVALFYVRFVKCGRHSSLQEINGDHIFSLVTLSLLLVPLIVRITLFFNGFRRFSVNPRTHKLATEETRPIPSNIILRGKSKCTGFKTLKRMGETIYECIVTMFLSKKKVFLPNFRYGGWGKLLGVSLNVHKLTLYRFRIHHN